MNILLAPENCKKLIQVKLPRPKDGSLQLFLYDEENLALYELTKYYDQFRSWFLDNLFCKDGHLHLLTKVDPLYLFIPQLIKYASQQFRTLHDICATFTGDNGSNGSNRLDYALTPDLKWDQICETKELDGELFVKFSEKKTLDWLSIKHDRTMDALKQQLDVKASKATLISYATDLIDLYLPPSISDKFKTIIRSKSLLSKEGDLPRNQNQTLKRPAANQITSFFQKK